MDAAIVVRGNSTTTPFAFTTDVTATAYNRKTGAFFVGLDSGTDAFTISRAPRPSFTTPPQFTGILEASSSLQTASIEFLAFSLQSSAPSILAVVPESTGPLQATTVTALFTGGTGETAPTASLLDAAGATSEGIVQLEANSSNIFAAIRPDSGDFGDADGGISLIGIGNNNSTSITLNIKNATTGIDGNAPRELQASSVELKGTGGGDDVVFVDPKNRVELFWDEPLQRLFIGVNIQSGTNGTDLAKAVVVARLDSGVLNLQAIVPDAAISAGLDEIVVTEGADIPVTPHHLRVMHASTGPDYLITDCAINNVCNRVFALPLVNDTTDSTSVTNGTLADINSALNSTTMKFTVPATAAGDLFVNNSITDPGAVVGAGDLPMGTGDEISDMVVLGDAVYVSLSFAPTSTLDSGIWQSQAEFDDEGKVIRWTPWSAKRTVPLNAFPGITLPGGATHNGSVDFFQVDGKAGNIWIVEGTTKQTVGISSWSTGVSSTDLISITRAALSESSYSVLDLNQATRGFLDTTLHRYALFGGVNKVAFARTSEARDITTLSSAQIAITDYSSNENFKTIKLPANAGCCQVLEYSRTSTTADNDSSHDTFGYFFAGTETGLYVFASIAGDGFNPSDLSTLNLPPFSTFAWQKAPNITGSVVDIKTSGRNLYVVTSESSSTSPLVGTIYNIPLAGTVATMFASANISTIAQTGVGIFEKALQFYGIQIVETGNAFTATPDSDEQLILATNHGLYHSDANQAGAAGIRDATTQAAASWTLVRENAARDTQNTMFNGIGGMDTPIPYTTWPFSVQDASGCSTFDRGSIHQFSGTGDSTDSLFNSFFVPEKFNANPQPVTSPFSTLFPIIYFYSDGGRRFFVFNRTTDPANQTRLGIIPFDINDWNVTQPDILNNPITSTMRRFYWVRSIGPTGIVMAGTETGVIGLQ